MLTRDIGVDEAGSLERFIIVFNALRLFWVILVVVMTSPISSSSLPSCCSLVRHQSLCTFVKRVACIPFLLLFIQAL